MWQEIGKLFTTTQIIPVIFVVLGIAMCVVEIFMLKATNIGLMGGVVIIGSMIVVMMMKGTLAQFLFLTFVVLIAIIVAFCIATLIKENGLFFRKSVKDTEKIDVKEIDSDNTLKKLIGKIGVAISDLDPNGKVVVNSVTLDAVSVGNKIEKNSNIKIVKINGINIMVQRIDEDNE